MKNKNRRSSSANGKLDNYAIRAEEYASYISRSRRPPQVTLERIANLAEKAIQYQHMRLNRHGNPVPDNRPVYQEQRERQRNKCLDRIWSAYQIVQEKEIMHSTRKGQDESWNDAKQDAETGKWVSSPVRYFDNETLEQVLADELHGNTAQGRTPIRSSNYEGNQGDDE